MTTKAKVLIGDDSIEQGITWATMMKERNLFAITRPKNGREILRSIKSDLPDVIIIEAKLPEMDAVEILKDIRSSLDVQPIVLVISNYDSQQLECEIMDAGANYYMVKPFESKTLVERVINLVKKSRPVINKLSFDVHNNYPSDIELVVTSVIHQIGIPAHIKGYQYLRTSIIFCIENPDALHAITKVLYPEVARHYSTTPSRVERAIRHAIEIAWDRGDVEILNSYFGYTIDTSRGKPTNSEFIALISDKIRLSIKTNASL